MILSQYSISSTTSVARVTLQLSVGAKPTIINFGVNWKQKHDIVMTFLPVLKILLIYRKFSENLFLLECQFRWNQQ